MGRSNWSVFSKITAIVPYKDNSGYSVKNRIDRGHTTKGKLETAATRQVRRNGVINVPIVWMESRQVLTSSEVGNQDLETDWMWGTGEGEFEVDHAAKASRRSQFCLHMREVV